MGLWSWDGCIYIGVGLLLIKHETFQSLRNLLPKNIVCERVGEGRGESKKFPELPFFSNFRNNVKEFVKYFGNIFLNLDFKIYIIIF
jgi:hypothetical protein